MQLTFAGRSSWSNKRRAAVSSIYIKTRSNNTAGVPAGGSPSAIARAVFSALRAPDASAILMSAFRSQENAARVQDPWCSMASPNPAGPVPLGPWFTTDPSGYMRRVDILLATTRRRKRRRKTAAREGYTQDIFIAIVAMSLLSFSQRERSHVSYCYSHFQIRGTQS